MMKLNIKRNTLFSLIALIAFTVLTGNSVYAAEKKDKSAKRAALMMQKMKQDMQAQMDQEKAAMQAQFDLKKKELEDHIKEQDVKLQELEVTKRKLKLTENSLKKVTSEKLALEEKLQETQTKLEGTEKTLADLNALYKQAQYDLKFNDGQRKTQLANLTETTKALNVCSDKNIQLHQFGSELINIYDKPDAYSAMMRKENFFQLKRVELENILQDKKDKMDEARFETKKTAY